MELPPICPIKRKLSKNSKLKLCTQYRCCPQPQCFFLFVCFFFFFCDSIRLTVSGKKSLETFLPTCIYSCIKECKISSKFIIQNVGNVGIQFLWMVPVSPSVSDRICSAALFGKSFETAPPLIPIN